VSKRTRAGDEDSLELQGAIALAMGYSCAQIAHYLQPLADDAERPPFLTKMIETDDMSNRQELANAIRALAMDAVQAAKSGHPGAPMGMADIAEVLWNDFLSHSPSNPNWSNRDRFVLSNGHGSMLIYALLHLSGYDLPIEELKNFRQLHSRTPA